MMLSSPMPTSCNPSVSDRSSVPAQSIAVALSEQTFPAASGPLVDAYRRPRPRLAEGALIAPLAGAMMDLSDGLLIDAARMAQASGVAITIDHIPLSLALEKARGASTAVQIAAARAGDDYELLFTLPRGMTPPVRAIPIGHVSAGWGLTLMIDGAVVPLPDRLGWEH